MRKLNYIFGSDL